MSAIVPPHFGSLRLGYQQSEPIRPRIEFPVPLPDPVGSMIGATAVAFFVGAFVWAVVK